MNGQRKHGTFTLWITMEYCSAIKINEILSFVTTWMELEKNVKFNKQAHAGYKKVDLTEVGMGIMVTRGWGDQGGERGGED
jgi:hypothetical protein